MKCIIVIKGTTFEQYKQIRQDLTDQIFQRNPDALPLFCLLPADYTDIEVVWLDEEMEKALFTEALEKVQI